MRRLLRWAALLALAASVSSCLVPPQSALKETASLATLYAAMSAGDELSSPIFFEVSAPAAAAGALVCPGSVLESCRMGRGEIRTLDHLKDLASGLRIFRTNLSWVPQDADLLTLVAHDAAGQLLGANVIRLERR